MIYIHEYYKLRTKINNKLLIVLPYLYFTRYLGYLGVSKFLPNFRHTILKKNNENLVQRPSLFKKPTFENPILYSYHHYTF